jgi:poly(A) polymerase
MITKFIKRILRRDPMAKHTQANHTGAPKRIPKKRIALILTYSPRMR